jgi:superfamily II DNA/RNA helicase
MYKHFRNAPAESRGFSGSAKRSSFGNKPSFAGKKTGGIGRGKGGSRFGGGRGRFGGNRGGQRGGFSKYINPSKFINKVTMTEEVQEFKPEHAFSDFLIDERLKNAIIKKGYTCPTPIQDRAIPHILKGSDLVGIANTGTGKTAAFLIPLIHKVLLNNKEQILIIVPTRELAIQIEQELKSLVFGMKIFSVCCVGGMNIGRQISALRYSNNFIIGTPGRLKDLINRGFIKPANFKTIVLDEADRMLDMGFVTDMRLVMSAMPKDRHTLFFSATLSSEIENLIKEFLNNPVRISVKTGETSKNIDQDVVRVGLGKNKLDVLHELLSQKDFSRVLIFGRTKHGVERLSKMLIERGFKADSIHGNKNHSKRQQALRLFKEGNVQVLVATDVAARGLDIADVSHVINYELPANYDDYVHRIGRTGRGNKKGKALTFVD